MRPHNSHNPNERPNFVIKNLTIHNYGSGDLNFNLYYGGQESQKAEPSGAPPNSKRRNLRNLIAGISSLAPLIYAVTELIKLFIPC